MEIFIATQGFVYIFVLRQFVTVSTMSSWSTCGTCSLTRKSIAGRTSPESREARDFRDPPPSRWSCTSRRRVLSPTQPPDHLNIRRKHPLVGLPLEAPDRRSETTLLPHFVKSDRQFHTTDDRSGGSARALNLSQIRPRKTHLIALFRGSLVCVITKTSDVPLDRFVGFLTFEGPTAV